MKRSILFSIILPVAFSISVHAQQNNAQGQQTTNQGQQNSNQPRTQQPRPQPPESTEWYYPVPQKVQPGTGTKPPSDAIILFDGKDLSKWRTRDTTAQWTVKDGELIVEPGEGSITTRE